MKKILYLAVVIAFVVFLSVKIMDSSAVFSFAVQDHLWLHFIGTWQCAEKGYLEMVFHLDETFAEYSYGHRQYTGAVAILDNHVILMYDAESCSRKMAKDCSVSVEYEFVRDKLILIVDNERLTFNRVADGS